ncbi:hypothetical protein [Archangium sp.]|uniref:hypothetical protein n=1 Tax=Archangium sp. TaxID=1872627 RepID=UPI002D257BB7|nr:hypothetical protein [Archangium sp.]HYO58209.1 hypothetical protein [Archangium sp.]
MTEPYTGKESAVRLTHGAQPRGGSEFAVWPKGIPLSAIPLYDEETKAVIGFYHESQGITRIFDLQGRMVAMEEVGLETPLIDPLDIFLLGGSIRAVTKGALSLFSRAGARATVRASAGMAAFLSSRAAGQAIGHSLRLSFRAVARKQLNFTSVTARHMAEAGRHVPVHILQQAIETGTRAADPQGVAGAYRYVTKMWKLVKSGSEYTWKEYTLEVVVREADWTVLHFLYR